MCQLIQVLHFCLCLKEMVFYEDDSACVLSDAIMSQTVKEKVVAM